MATNYSNVQRSFKNFFIGHVLVLHETRKVILANLSKEDIWLLYIMNHAVFFFHMGQPNNHSHVISSPDPVQELYCI